MRKVNAMEDFLKKAVDFAFEAHKGQKRKDGTPYILHPLEVMTILGTMTGDYNTLASAVLHDTVEDTPVTAEEILSTFGERIAYLVACETEDKRQGIDPRLTWKIRKEESLEELKNCNDIEVKKLWVADKVSNMRALSRAFSKDGNLIFESFNEKNPSEQRWYHASVLEYTKELSGFSAYKEYEALFNYIFGEGQK